MKKFRIFNKTSTFAYAIIENLDHKRNLTNWHCGIYSYSVHANILSTTELMLSKHANAVSEYYTEQD